MIFLFSHYYHENGLLLVVQPPWTLRNSVSSFKSVQMA